MSNTASGRLHIKGQTQQISDKFSKREFVIATTDQYPQFISFQLANDKTSLLDSANVGDEITVHFNLRGREWKSPDGVIKYFNTLDAWKIEVTGRTTAVKGVDSGTV